MSRGPEVEPGSMSEAAPGDGPGLISFKGSLFYLPATLPGHLDIQLLIMQFVKQMDPCFHTAPSNIFHCILNSCYSECVV